MLERAPSDKVAWAFVAIKSGERPAASWYAYALHDVLDRRMWRTCSRTGNG